MYTTHIKEQDLIKCSNMQKEIFHEKGVDLTGSFMAFFEYFKTTLSKMGTNQTSHGPLILR